MKAAIYIRVSTGKQAKGLSLSEQERTCREYINRLKNKYDIGDIQTFVDPGRSAKDLDRKCLNELREYNPNFIVVSDIDRLVRDIRDFFSLAYEYRILTADRGYDSQDEDDEFRMELDAVFAKRERQKIIQRTVKGRKAAAKLGRYGGRTPCGYRKVKGEIGQLEIDLEVAPVVARAFELYANEGHSLSDIALYFNSQSIPAKYAGNGQWSTNSALKVLTGKTYRGIIKWGDIEYKAERLRIVSDELWDRVQLERTRRRTWDPKVHKRRCPGFLLRGIIHHCGKPMRSHHDTWRPKTGDPRVYKSYRCSLCGRRYRKEEINKAVIDSIFKHILKRNILKQIKAAATELVSTETSDTQGQDAKIRNQIRDKEKAIENLYKGIERQPSLADDATPRIRKYRDEIEALESILRDLSKPPPMEGKLAFIKTIKVTEYKKMQADESIPVSLRRGAISELIDRIDLTEDDMSIYPALPGIEPFVIETPEIIRVRRQRYGLKAHRGGPHTEQGP